VLTGVCTSKFDTLFHKSLNGIHSALCEVYGESAVDRSTLSRWASSFHEGQTGVEGAKKHRGQVADPSWHFTVMSTLCFQRLSWRLLLFLFP